MTKNYDTESVKSTLSNEDLELINKQSLKKLEPEEVFTFSVILCDNEIDRDFERFSDKALKSLETLFVGKTGILNHSNRSEDQTCRTYKTELITDESRVTSYGETYKYLKAWCYTVKSQKNEDFIRDIEGGIKKEVSVSCNFSEKICSVCGEGVCNHRSGEYYGDTLCYKTLCGVTDAYEWSFVAVPAQRGAGVTKSAKKKSTKEAISEAKLKKDLEFSSLYREELRKKAQKGFALTLPELSSDVAEKIISLLNAEALLELTKAFSKRTSVLFPAYSQLGEKEQTKNDNSQFKF